VPEKSQVLEKVFAHMRSIGLRPRRIAEDLHLTPKEFNRHVFGLATTVHTAEDRDSVDSSRGLLRLVQ